MKAVKFKESTVIIGEHQPEFNDLPAHYDPNDGSMVFCFEFDEDEIKEILKTKQIYFKQVTQGRPFQAVDVSVKIEGFINQIKEEE